MKFGKRAELFNSVMIQIILIGIILALFLTSISGKMESRGVKQQVLENEVALLIDAGVPGMDFEVRKINVNGKVSNVEVRNSRIYINIEGLNSINGYPYFSKYDVEVYEFDDKFVVSVK